MRKISCPHCHQEIILGRHVNVQKIEELTLKRKKRKELEETLLEKIRQGIPVTSAGDKKIVNTLTRLRRNGVIQNEGTRKNPKWVIVEPSPAESIYEIPEYILKSLPPT